MRSGLRRRKSERGQGVVEVALCLVVLVFTMFLIVQLAWIAIQKFQFNHFAAYASRVWSVHKDQGSEEALFSVMLPSLFMRWNLVSKDYVKFMWVSSEDAKDVDGGSVPGLTFTGVAVLFPLYQEAIGDAFSGTFIPPSVAAMIPVPIPSFGLISFQSFIPMEKEPDEQPGADRDNDCSETPCESGNKQ
jgi:TadE-like protein